MLRGPALPYSTYVVSLLAVFVLHACGIRALISLLTVGDYLCSMEYCVWHVAKDHPVSLDCSFGHVCTLATTFFDCCAEMAMLQFRRILGT